MLFKFVSTEKQAKIIADKYALSNWNIDVSKCKITVEDDGVYWVIIYKGEHTDTGYPQVIIKKSNGKIVNSFIYKPPKLL